MAIISTYSKDLSITANDKLLGSNYQGLDNQGRPIFSTVNYRVDDLLTYFTQNIEVDGANLAGLSADINELKTNFTYDVNGNITAISNSLISLIVNSTVSDSYATAAFQSNIEASVMMFDGQGNYTLATSFADDIITTTSSDRFATSTKVNSLGSKFGTFAGDTFTLSQASIQNIFDTFTSLDFSNVTYITDIEAVVAGRPKVFRQITAPATTEPVGSIWYDTDDDNKVYILVAGAPNVWTLTDDSRIGASVTQINNMSAEFGSFDVNNNFTIDTNAGYFTAVKSYADTNSAAAQKIVSLGAELVTFDVNNNVSSISLSSNFTSAIDAFVSDINNSAIASKVEGIRVQVEGSDGTGGVIADVTSNSAAIAVKPDVFRQALAPATTEAVGSIWFDTDDNNKAYVLVAGTPNVWTETRDQELIDIVATKPFIFRQISAPATSNPEGSLWYDTDDENKLYVLASSTWVLTQDGDIATAQATADGRPKVFRQISAPATTEPEFSVWYDTDDNNLTYVLIGDGGNPEVFTWTQTIDGRVTDLLAFAEAKYSLNVDANGVVTGLELYSASGPNTTVSEFKITADKFIVRESSTDFVPFILDGSALKLNVPLNGVSGSFSGDISAATGTIGGWTINPSNLQSPLVGGVNKLTLSPANGITIKDPDNNDAVQINQGALSQISSTTAGIIFGDAVNGYVTSLETNNTSPAGIYTYAVTTPPAPDEFTYSLGLPGAFQVGDTAGIYAFSFTSAATGTLVSTDANFSGQILMQLGVQFASDSGFSTIISDEIIDSKSITGASQSLALSGASKDVSLGLAALATIYFRFYWRTYVKGHKGGTMTFTAQNANFNDTTGTITFNKYIGTTEITDEGVQIVDAPNLYFKVDRANYLSGNPYVDIAGYTRIDGDLDVTGSINIVGDVVNSDVTVDNLIARLAEIDSNITIGAPGGVTTTFRNDINVLNATTTNTLNATTSISTPMIQLTGGTGTQGQMTWNADEETLDLINNGAVLQLGQEIHVHVRNNSATVAIPNGTPVYVAGTLGASGRLKVAPMIADGSISSEYFLGVTTEEIEPDGDGKVTWFGKVRDFDTSLLGEGTKLYVSETVAGGWQTNHPTSPNPKLEVAFTVNAKTNGTVFIRANNGYKLDDLHDVEIVSPVNGDLLVYNSTLQRWENTNTVGDLTAANLTATSLTLTDKLSGPNVFYIDPSPNDTYADGVVDTGKVVILGDLEVTGQRTQFTSTTVVVNDKNLLLGFTDVTQTFNTTLSSTVIITTNDLAGIAPGMEISGAGIPAGTTVVSINSTTQLTMSAAATATATGVSLTFAMSQTMADGAGLTIGGTTATLLYASATDDFTFSKTVNAATFVGALTGNASTASTWQTARTLTIGDTGKSVNGSANVSWSRAELGITKVNIDALNINADFVDGKHATDFNLAYVTGNGATTTNAISIGALTATTGTFSSNLQVDDKITITGTTNNLLIDETADGTWRFYDTFQNNGFYLYSGSGGMDFHYNGVSQMVINGSGVVFTGTVDISSADLNIGAADIIFDTASTLSNRGLVWDVDGGFLSKLVGGGTSGGMVELYTNLDDAITTGDVFRIKEGSTAATLFSINGNGAATFSSTIAAAGGNSTQWNTAYSYSQVGHLPLAGGTVTGNLQVNGYVRGNGQQLVLNAGESSGIATGQTSEYVYINAEAGLEINSSPDNWATGWAGRKTAYINKSDGTSSLPGTLTVAGHGNSSQWNTAYGWGNWATGVTKTFVDNLGINATTVDGFQGSQFLRSDTSDTMTGALTLGDDSSTNGALTLAQLYTGNDILGNISSGYSSGSMIIGWGMRGSTTARDYFVSTHDNFSSSKAAIAIGDSGEIEFWHSDANAIVAVGVSVPSSRSFVIKADGNAYFNNNVGIGTTSPRGTLDLKGNGIYLGYGSTNVNERDWLISTNYAAYGDFVIRQSNAKDGNPYSAGTTRLTIDSSGSVGIGVTPTEKADIYGNIKIGTTANSNVLNRSDSHWIQYNGGSTTNNTYIRVASVSAASIAKTISFWTDAVQRVTIGATGNVGIGTTSPVVPLHIGNGTNQQQWITNQSVAGWYSGIKLARGTGNWSTTQNNNFGFVVTDTGLEVNKFTTLNDASRTTIGLFNASGDFHADGNIIGYSTTISDIRFKDEVKTIENALELTKRMRGAYWTWNAGSKKGTQSFGHIAQEVENITPDIVKEIEMPLMDSSGKLYKTIESEQIIGIHTEAIKQLAEEKDREIAELKARISKLEELKA